MKNDMESLVQAIRNLLSPSVQCEVLSAFLIPKQIIDAIVTPATLSSMTQPFFAGLEQAVARDMGSATFRRYGPDDHGILGEVFHLDAAIITFYLEPAHAGIRQYQQKVPLSAPDLSSPCLYTGTLSVRQEGLDFLSAGAFLQHLLADALLAYNQKEPGFPDFLVYHDVIFKNGKTVSVSSGKPLLDKLHVTPQEVCRYIKRGGHYFWTACPFPPPVP